MLKPRLVLGFKSQEDAELAFEQHVCLCRNEDVMLPDAEVGIKEVTEEGFDNIPGFELQFTGQEEGFMVGYNRFNDFEPMYGNLEITEGAIRDDIL